MNPLPLERRGRRVSWEAWALASWGCVLVWLPSCTQDGDEPGNPGSLAEVVAVEEPAGSNCEFGGVAVLLGQDESVDGVLDAESVLDRQYVCHESGEDGRLALVRVEEAPAGEPCTSGGQRLDWGWDADEDTVLEDSEVSQTRYLCNGGELESDGVPVLVSTEVIPVGSMCGAGGILFRVGPDRNGNGSLDTDETSSTSALCQGEDGRTSPEHPGAAGLVRLDPEAPGARCPGGGIRVAGGTDLDGDAELDDAEVTTETFVCAGVDAIGAPCEAGERLCNGVTPMECRGSSWLALDRCEYACIDGYCGGACVPGQYRCDGNTLELCGLEGTWVGSVTCPYVCRDALCSGECVPGTHQCASADSAQTCEESGTWSNASSCDDGCADGACR